MCGRVIQSSRPLRLAIVDGLDVSDSQMGNVVPRYNAAPSQELLVIRQNHNTGERSIDLIKWGLIPHWCKDPKGILAGAALWSLPVWGLAEVVLIVVALFALNELRVCWRRS